MVEPGPQVRRALGTKPVQVRQSPLQPDGAGMRGAHGGKHAIGAGQAQHANFGLGDRQTRRARVAPEIDQTAVSRCEPPQGVGPVGGHAHRSELSACRIASGVAGDDRTGWPSGAQAWTASRMAQ